MPNVKQGFGGGAKTKKPSPRRFGGFKPVATHLQTQTKKLGTKRGFYDQFLIRNWRDVVGVELAKICRPRELKSTRNGGSTLVLECVGAYAPELTMRSDEIRARINGAVGHEAIAKIQLAHQASGFDTAGFAEGAASFDHKPVAKAPPPIDLITNIGQAENNELRAALDRISMQYYTTKGHKIRKTT